MVERAKVGPKHVILVDVANGELAFSRVVHLGPGRGARAFVLRAGGSAPAAYGVRTRLGFEWFGSADKPLNDPPALRSTEMTVSRIFTTTAVALSAFAAAGCGSPSAQYANATPAPIVVQAAPPPAPVVMAEMMPPQLPPNTVVAYTATPVVVTSNSPSYTSPAINTERAPRADRN